MTEITEKKAEKRKQDEYDVFGAPPSDFDAKEKWRIQVFSERLKEVREAVGFQQKDLARELGISIMMVSNYEKARIAEVPMRHLRRICAFYSVSPHYLLGYVEEKEDYLRLDKNRNVILDNQGKAKLLHQGFIIAPESYQNAVETYKGLYEEDTEFFYLINRMLTSEWEKRYLCKRIVKEILSYEKNSKMTKRNF